MGGTSSLSSKADELWRRTEAIFGASRFRELVDLHREGEPIPRHRLIDQLIALDGAKSGRLSALREDLAVVSVPEVDSVVRLAEEALGFASATAWQEIRRGLASAAEYLHSVGVIQVASLLRVHHPATEFQVTSGAKREPDLILLVTDGLPLAVEVKAPAALWQPSTALELGAARQLIRNELANAGTVKGQLRDDRPGVLALVGLYMSIETYSTLVRGLEGHLTVDGERIKHVIGLAVSNLRSRVESERGFVSPLLEQQSVIRRNPAYRGRLHIDNDWAGPWRLIER